MLSELAFPHIRCCLSAIPSDLMKSKALDESLSSMNQQFCSRENQLLQMSQQNEKSTQMDFKVIGKYFFKQESGLVINDVGNKLLTKSVMFCRMTPFVITEEGDIITFTGGKMEAVYQVDGQFFEFF